MPSALRKLGSRFFIYLVAFVLLFSFVVLCALGLQTKIIRDNIGASFTEFSDEVNEVSERLMNDSADSFIENYVEMEANAFSYIVNVLKSDLNYLSDNITLRYESYENDKSYYDDLIRSKRPKRNIGGNLEDYNKIKVFYQPGIDRNAEIVKKDLGILYDLEDDLLLTITDALQSRNCYVLTENGVSIFASNYDYNNSPKYAGDELDYKSESWYQRTIATTSIVFNSAYKDALSNKDIISVEKSFKVNGNVYGVIVIEVYLDSLNATSISLEPPEGVNLFFADEN